MLRPLVHKVCRFGQSLRKKKNRARARWIAWFYGGNLTFAKSSKFNFRVTANGEGSVEVKDHVMLGYDGANCVGTGEIFLQCRKKDAKISIGEGTICTSNLSVVAQEAVTIGKECNIGDMVSILDSDFHGIGADERKQEGESAPVVIEDNVWLGNRVIVLKGVTIGENSVVAAGAVVTNSIPSNVIAGGVPAKVIRDL